MTREELREHCEKQIRACEMWAHSQGERPCGKIYEEHRLILELLEQEPTTKNDLGVDVVSRKDVHDMLENLPITVEDKWFNWLQKACMRLAELPSVTPQLSSELAKNSKKLEKNFGELDCISRAEMLSYQQYLHGKMSNEENHKLWEFIKALPSVTPQEPRWIPVSERLPEPNRLVLCYITTGATETYFLALWNDTLNAWEEGIGGYRLLENDLGYEVIAWMSLPKPYRAESEKP